MRTFLLTALLTLAAVAIGFSAETVATPDFVKKAAQFSHYEVQAGQIATQKGQSEAVKQFGRDIAAAHDKAAAEFTGIVRAEKLEVKLPSKPSKKQREAIEALKAAAPADFDKTYAEQQIKAYNSAVKLFDGYAAGGDNAALKQFATTTGSLLEQHLEQAKKLVQ